MAVFVNDDIVVKHRFKGGQHATFNNALWSGKTVITGHLHSQRVSPITDYWGNTLGSRYRMFGLHPRSPIRLHRIQSLELGQRVWRVLISSKAIAAPGTVFSVV